MRIPRLFTEQPLKPGLSVCLEGHSAHYLSRVMRIRPGQHVQLFNGDGHDYPARVGRIGKGDIELLIEQRLQGCPEPALEITLVQAVSRGERMDQTLQKCTELGVAAFQPVWSERVEVRLEGGRLERRMAHWRAVVVSACEQSGRAIIPPVAEPVSLEGWLVREAHAPRLVLSPGADLALAESASAAALALLVGPEGGFSESEMDRLRARNVRAVALGPRTLRTETAGPAAVAVLQAVAGDLRGLRDRLSRPVE